MEASQMEIDPNEYEEFAKQWPQDEPVRPKVQYWPRKEDPVIPYPTVNIITRKMWGAELPTKVIDDYLPHDVVMLENDPGVDFCFTKRTCFKRVRELQRQAMEEGESDIRYNFLLGEDGNVYEGRGWHTQSARTLKALYDYPHRLDVAYLGKYDSNKPNIDLYVLLKTLLRFGVKEGYIARGFSLVEVKDDLRFNKYVVDLSVYIQTLFHS